MTQWRWLCTLAAIAAVAIAPSESAAQATQTAPAVPGGGFGFHATLGWTSISGDYGDLMTGGIPAEGGAWYQTGSFRGGLNIHVASYDVVKPFESQSISQVGLTLSALWRFRTSRSLQPFVGIRAGAIRFRPEGALFDPNPPGPEVPPGENPAPERTGFVGGISGGLEYWLNRHVAIQGSIGYRIFSTDELDVPLVGASGIESGGAVDLSLGVEWAI